MARETSTNLEKEGDDDSGKPLLLSAVLTESWFSGGEGGGGGGGVGVKIHS